MKKPIGQAALAASIIALSTAINLPASAQVDEIIVTARKKAESLQKTPISVVAMSAEKLEAQSVGDLTNLDVKFPNVGIGGSGGLGGSNAAFFIRGIGADRNAVNQETAVALYVDDAYYGRTDGALLSVLDVEQIEISRGPQGTLFGRGATAGAIRYITKKPKDFFEASLQGIAGSFSRVDVKAMINVPLGETAALRVSAASLNRDGHVIGAFTGRDYGNENSKLVRGALRWNLSDRLEVLASVDHTSLDNNGVAAVAVEVFSGAPFYAAEAAAVATPFTGSAAQLSDFGTSYATGDNFLDSSNTGANFTLTYDISDNISFKSASTYRDINVKGAYDGDGMPFDLFEQNFVRDITMYSQELQLSGDTENVDWLAGLFYYNENASDIREVGLTSNAGPNRTGTRIINPYTVESYAAFGQATINLSEQFSVTGGIRYTQDDKSIAADELRGNGVSRLVGLADPNNPSQTLATGDFVTRSDSWNAISGRFSLEYQASDDMFLFGSFARGYRSGGFNDRIRTDTGTANFYGVTPFDEETLDMFELGMRNEFWDNRARFNLTAFLGKYNNMQIPAILPGTTRTVVQNVGKSEIKGIEGELAFAVTDNFTLDGAFGVLDAKYTELNSTAARIAVTTDSEFGRAPDFSYTVGATYENGPWMFRADYGWQDDYRLLTPDANTIIQESYGLLSAKVSYGPKDARWKVSVFGTNIGDEDYAISGLKVSNPLGFAAIQPGRPAELGVTLDLNFD